MKATEARDRAMEQVDENASPLWKLDARDAVLGVALRGKPFTSTDVWNTGLRKPREPRALGPILTGLHKEGLIRPTGQFPQGRQVSRHAAPEREWIRNV